MFKATFTLAEAAHLLSCHSETLRRAIKDGSLRAARLGREYRVSRVDLQDFWTARGGRILFEDPDAPSTPYSEAEVFEPTDGEDLAEKSKSIEPADNVFTVKNEACSEENKACGESPEPAAENEACFEDSEARNEDQSRLYKGDCRPEADCQREK